MEHTSVDNLKLLTEDFFSKHWNPEAIDSAIPQRSMLYKFDGSLPNYDKQGVYAFVKNGEVTYIGVGASSNGTGRYAGHGLGKRFLSYSKVENGKHVPTDTRLIEAGSMITIGFEPEQSYLAYALEMFLIGKIKTQYNVNRPSK